MPKKKSKTSAKKGKRTRQERRFVSNSSTNKNVVYAIAWISALLIGAGIWAYVYGDSFKDDDSLRLIPQYVLAGGIIFLGVAVWMGTSSEPNVRVGDPGIAVEKGDIRRMAWWAIDKITFEPGALAIVVAGTDESNVDWTFKVPVKSHPEAVGWLVEEAQERIPRRVDIPEETLEKLPPAASSVGEVVPLEPLQVVGKKCAATGKLISYEPDACVCARCERVYLKKKVPRKCKCGNSLEHLRPKTGEDAAGEDDDSDEAPESEPEDHDTELAAATAEPTVKMDPPGHDDEKTKEESAES